MAVVRSLPTIHTEATAMMVVCFSDKNRMKNAIRLSAVVLAVLVVVEGGTSPLRAEGAHVRRSVNLANVLCVVRMF